MLALRKSFSFWVVQLPGLASVLHSRCGHAAGQSTHRTAICGGACAAALQLCSERARSWLAGCSGVWAQRRARGAQPVCRTMQQRERGRVWRQLPQVPRRHCAQGPVLLTTALTGAALASPDCHRGAQWEQTLLTLKWGRWANPVFCAQRVRGGCCTRGRRRAVAVPAPRHAGPPQRRRGRARASAPRARRIAGGVPARAAAGGQRRRVAPAPYRCVA